MVKPSTRRKHTKATVNRTASLEWPACGPKHDALFKGLSIEETARTECMKKIHNILKHHGFAASPNQLWLLSGFHLLLTEANKRCSLSGITKFEDVVVKHYIDSLMVLQFIDPLPSPLMDFGSGAGIPGVILKIFSPHTDIVLAERSMKRAAFLKQVCSMLQFSGLQVVSDDITAAYRVPVKGIIARAVGSIESIMSRVRGCLEPSGLLILMKGPKAKDELHQSNRFLKQFVLQEQEQYNLPMTDIKRTLLVFLRQGVDNA